MLREIVTETHLSGTENKGKLKQESLSLELTSFVFFQKC